MIVKLLVIIRFFRLSLTLQKESFVWGKAAIHWLCPPSLHGRKNIRSYINFLPQDQRSWKNRILNSIWELLFLTPTSPPPCALKHLSLQSANPKHLQCVPTTSLTTCFYFSTSFPMLPIQFLTKRNRPVCTKVTNFPQCIVLHRTWCLAAVSPLSKGLILQVFPKCIFR